MRYALVRGKKNILKGVLEYMVHGVIHICCNTMIDVMDEKKKKNLCHSHRDHFHLVTFSLSQSGNSAHMAALNGCTSLTSSSHTCYIGLAYIIVLVSASSEGVSWATLAYVK